MRFLCTVFFSVALSSTALAQNEGFEPMFNGRDLTGWTGDTDGYAVEDSAIVCLPGKGENLYFDRAVSDFTLRFQFRLDPGANNGIGIRAEMGKDAAYYGMEIQVIDNTAERWKDIKPWQKHGSIYGVVPAKTGYLRPAGEWNDEEIDARGNLITVTLNGHTIVDADIAEAATDGTIDGHDHPGLFRKSGYIGFLGHGDRVAFRDLRLRER